MILLFLIGCAGEPKPGSPDLSPPDTGDVPTTDSGLTDSSGEEESGDSAVETSDTEAVAVEEIPGETAADDACPALYSPDALQAFSIEIADADWAALLADYAAGAKSYHPIVFRYKDEAVDDAVIRLKGNPSFSWFTEKMQFVIAFNEEDPDGRFHGLRKISLDASWYEPTLLRDRVAWATFRSVPGLPAACANSATLTVNGEYYGLYTNIEYFDHEWLERVFGDEDATGTLWKYGYDAVANADATTGAVTAMASTTDPATLATLGDLSEWELAWAAEVVTGDDDGYWCCNHNFYLYEHPTRGVLFVPWDFDDDFDVQPYDADPITGYYSGLFLQPHFQALVHDPTWGPAFVDQVEVMNDALDPDVALAEMDAWEDQISDALFADPHRSIGWDEHLAAVERMRAWIPARHAFLASWVACQRGETVDGDGDGYAVCDDPNDADANVHPAATETCNGADDDADGWVDDDAACDDCARHDVDDGHFLYCRWPRTAAAAETNCEDRGGALSAPVSTAEYYMNYFYTWPVIEGWWIGGGSGASCLTWEEPSFTLGTADCGAEHPSICRLP